MAEMNTENVTNEIPSQESDNGATVNTSTSKKNEPTLADLQAQIQDLMTTNAKLKRSVDKASSEAADYKKKFKASMSEVEQASLEKAEKEAEREEQFKALQRENHINKLEKSYMSLGYTADEASKMAEAEADNDFDAKKKIMAEVDARKRKEYEAEFIKNRPTVNAGVGGENPEITKEQFDKLGYNEIVQFKTKYPETYKVYSKR